MPAISADFLILQGAIFIRAGIIIFFLPIIGESPTPLPVRILLSIAFMIAISSMVPSSFGENINLDPIILALSLAREIIFGFTIGFAAKAMFEGILLASSVVGYQMGFGMSNLILPGSSDQMNSFTALHRAILILIFLVLNLHHFLLITLAQSYDLVPISMEFPNSDLAHLLIRETSMIFSTGIKLASPIIVALMFTMSVMGLMARTVPQMNVFTMSFPVSFFVGLAIYVFMTPFLPKWYKDHFSNLSEYIISAVNLF